MESGCKVKSFLPHTQHNSVTNRRGTGKNHNRRPRHSAFRPEQISGMAPPPGNTPSCRRSTRLSLARDTALAGVRHGSNWRETRLLPPLGAVCHGDATRLSLQRKPPPDDKPQRGDRIQAGVEHGLPQGGLPQRDVRIQARVEHGMQQGGQPLL